MFDDQTVLAYKVGKILGLRLLLLVCIDCFCVGITLSTPSVLCTALIANSYSAKPVHPPAAHITPMQASHAVSTLPTFFQSVMIFQSHLLIFTRNRMVYYNP